MNVFVCDKIDGEKAWLSEDEAFHCFKVLRKTSGQEITLIDGNGTFYNAIIESISKKSCELKIQNQRTERKKPYYLHLAIAPTKNISRLEWFLEKAVEIGIDELSLVICEHSERKRINTDRLKRIAIGASKQSLSASFPKINEVKTLNAFIEETNVQNVMIAHLDKEEKHLKHMKNDNNAYLILIGPEGDFSTNELELFNKLGWPSVILGHKRLRTETAGVVASQILSSMYF